MDKYDVMVTLDECFREEGVCIVLHFINGNDLLIDKKPLFNNLILIVEMEYSYNDKIINEEYYIPYSGILYITKTNRDNLELIHRHNIEQYQMV